MKTLFWYAALGLALAGCSAPRPRTQVLVDVDAEGLVRAETTSLRVVVRGAPVGTPLLERDDRTTRVSASDGSWPNRTAIIPVGDDDRRTFEIEVTARDPAGQTVAQARARMGFVRGKTLLYRIVLEDRCRGVVCTARQTCSAGACVSSFVDPADLVETDGGRAPAPDAGLDGSADGGAPCQSNAACDDGLFCNGAESCADGRCVPGRRVTCDDGIDCTSDSCSLEGCLNEPVDSACTAAPGGRCTRGNGCQYAECTPQLCVSSGCSSATCVGSMCVRTTACQTGEMCCGGACVAAGCDDGNPCTTDACGPMGCIHTASTGPCSDSNKCTVGDVCSDGRCMPGAPRACDDGNACTTDACDASSGECTATIRTGACDDGAVCTTGDTCTAGACRGTASPSCDDGVACTRDSGTCRAAGDCVNTPDDRLCNAAQGGVCDAQRGCQYATCSAATCTSTPCETATCVSTGCLRTPVICDDNNPCTDDTCAGGCVHTPNRNACNDGNACTANDQCSNGACTGTAITCGGGGPCRTPTCVPARGCEFTDRTGMSCDDADPCTLSDKCVSGTQCAGTRNTCDDQNACTVDACGAGGLCSHVSTGTRNDGNPCTMDVCAPSMPGGCDYIPMGGARCDDDNRCTSDDVCLADGSCSGTNACVGTQICCSTGCQPRGTECN